jgi:hypothetical protein
MIMRIGGTKYLSLFCGKKDTFDAFKIEAVGFIVKLQFNETR